MHHQDIYNPTYTELKLDKFTLKNPLPHITSEAIFGIEYLILGKYFHIKKEMKQNKLLVQKTHGFVAKKVCQYSDF